MFVEECIHTYAHVYLYTVYIVCTCTCKIFKIHCCLSLQTHRYYNNTSQQITLSSNHVMLPVSSLSWNLRTMEEKERKIQKEKRNSSARVA